MSEGKELNGFNDEELMKEIEKRGIKNDRKKQPKTEAKENSGCGNLIAFLGLAFVILFLGICLISRCSGDESDNYKSNDQNDTSVSSGPVTYKITTESGVVYKVSLTFENDSGGTEQGDYSVPFTKSYYGFSSGDFLYISAQIIEPTENAGSISCKILDGKI